MVQQQRALVLLPEDQSLIPNTFMVAHNYLSKSSVPGDPTPLMASVGIRHGCNPQTYRQNTQTHEINR